ncbi:MAG: hypothetical protein HY205_07175 [Nitrospirae bacterium]|nr:hypothetical protein [Nitrospirota bacterium]
MKTWSTLGTFFLCSLLALPAWADEKDKVLEERVKKLEKALEEFKEHERRERGPMEPFKTGETPSEPGLGPLPDVAKDLRREQQAPLSFSSTGSGRLVYAKPFVAAPKAIVGGYMDIQYRNQRKGRIDNGAAGNPGIGETTSTFDQQRFVPFFYADVTEHVKVASELEIEHGIREQTGANNELEIGLEFATIDYLIKEQINLRAGVLLLPVGKFNLLHDSPLNDLSDRPLVSQYVIPTTMSETGAGFYGTFYPGRLSKVDYELYVVTGSNGYQRNGTPRIVENRGLRNSRQRKSETDDGLDNNNGKGVVGRMAYSPVLGMEVAGSGYYSTYDPQNKRSLSIYALDWTFQRGPVELIGEAAWSYISGNSQNLPGTAQTLYTGADGVPRLRPQRMSGMYAQMNYHFMPEFLSRLSPSRFGPGSTFTAVLRWDQINTNLDYSAGADRDQQRLTVGLNYRPIEDAVFKLDYQFNMQDYDPVLSKRLTGNNTLVLSAATYF